MRTPQCIYARSELSLLVGAKGSLALGVLRWDGSTYFIRMIYSRYFNPYIKIMTDVLSKPAFTAFAGHKRLARGALADVAVAVLDQGEDPVLVFDDATGRIVDLDLRGTSQEVAARYVVADAASDSEGPRGRGRPKLGVVAREVTLLPRHWEWLQGQSGGASAALRRLVDEARKNDAGAGTTKMAQERSYRFLTALAGDLPQYEDVVRAIFANDPVQMQQLMRAWPQDIQQYASDLLVA